MKAFADYSTSHYTLANKIKRNDVERGYTKHGRGHVYTNLVGKPERNRLLRKLRRGWDDIKMDFIEMRRRGVK